MKGVKITMTVPTDVNYTSQLTKEIIHSLAKEYPFVSVSSIGKSVMGSDIYALKCGYGEKKVFINAAHHANEWITTPLLLKFMQRYLSAYDANLHICGIDAKELFMGTTVVCVPLVNPDGVDLVNGAIEKNSPYYQKATAISANYEHIPFPDGWKANIEGVDLNLNYPALWNSAKKIKKEKGIDSPAPRDYVGTSPLCAPEARALYDLTVASGFCLTLSYHTQGKVIYWKYLDFLPQNSYEIAQNLSKASGYAIEVTPSESGFAGYKDWFISQYNLPGYTVEAGEGKSPLPKEQFDTIYEANEPLLVSALNLV